MKGKILVTLTRKEKELVDRIVVAPLLEQGYEVVAIYENTMLGEEELMETIKDVDGYIVGLERVNENVFAAAQKLKVVCKFGVGTDNIDKKAAAKAGVVVANCPNLNSLSVAELVVGVMLSMSRSIPVLDSEMKKDTWISSMGTELTGKTLGIIGMGAIGKCLVKLVQGFDLKILAFDVFKDEEFAARYGVEFANVEDIIPQADFLSLHVPLTESTRGLISAKQLQQMKESAFLINTARGGVVDEADLLKALEDGVIAGAALDAFMVEPPVGSDLVKHKSVIALPHIGAATWEATERIGMCAMKNVTNVLEGKPAVSEVKA